MKTLSGKISMFCLAAGTVLLVLLDQVSKQDRKSVV